MVNHSPMVLADGGRNKMLEKKIIRKLLAKGVVGKSNKKPKAVVLDWFPRDDRTRVSDTISDMVSTSRIPVEEEDGDIYIDDYDDAQDYRDNHGFDKHDLDD